jgi:hypothetical protein
MKDENYSFRVTEYLTFNYCKNCSSVFNCNGREGKTILHTAVQGRVKTDLKDCDSGVYET